MVAKLRIKFHAFFLKLLNVQRILSKFDNCAEIMKVGVRMKRQKNAIEQTVYFKKDVGNIFD